MSTNFIGLYGIQDVTHTAHPQLVHDHNIAVFNEGHLTHFLHLERYTRNKYDARLNLFAEDIFRNLKLTKKANIKAFFSDYELGRSFLSSGGRIRFESSFADTLASKAQKDRLYWFDGFTHGFTVPHELAHIYSAVPFYDNFEPNSLLIHFDGGASLSNFSAWQYNHGEASILEYHYQLKPLSSLFNANALVFSMVEGTQKNQNSVPGKFMGLASFGKYSKEIETWLVKNKYFANIWSSKKKFYAEYEKLSGEVIYEINIQNPIIQDIAATIHAVFIRETLSKLKILIERTKSRTMYFTGGCALNIKLNSAILDSGLVDKLCIPPCTNDSGLALGAATFGSMENGIIPQIISPYQNNYGIVDFKESQINHITLQKLADMIYSDAIIGICNGYGELGPRALGNRSIIARADSLEIAKKVSQEIKGREWYRPVAPMMTKQNASYFTGKNTFPEIAKYMLLDFQIKEIYKKELEGCVHIDGTSRIQVLFNEQDNVFMYRLLNLLQEKHKLRAVINTSFNYRGEPIVHTPEDALKSAKRMKLDGVVLNGELIVL